MDSSAAEEAKWTALGADAVMSDVWEFRREAVAELSICLDLAQGATRCPYGVLITLAPPPSRAGRLLTGSLEASELRRAADGRTLLISRRPDTPLHLLRLTAPLNTDVDCEALVHATGGVLLRVDGAGRIWLVGSTAISQIDGSDSWTRPHTSGVIAALTTVVPGADHRTVAALAKLAYSHLSPARVGATLVYRWTSDDDDDDPAWFGGVALSPLGLNVNEATHLSGILHQVEHRDGATVFGRTGVLRRAGVILLASATALRTVDAVRGGTRHHSAAWYSNERPDVLCFVVARAGRVTVFNGGRDMSPAPRLPLQPRRD